VYCWACGTKLPEAATFCPECGIRVDDDSDELDEPYEDSNDLDEFFHYGSGAPIQTQTTAAPPGQWSPAPSSMAPPERPGGLGLRREGPIGALASLLSLHAALAAIYLAVRFWGEDRETSVRVLGALALSVLAPLLVGLVFMPIALVLGLMLRRTSDEARWSAGAFGRSVYEGLTNIASLAALGYIFLRLWETFQ
jgi:hypothetical protein